MIIGNKMTCHECLRGKPVRIVGNGITEPPYINLVRCPYDNKYYKNPDDTCSLENEELGKNGSEQSSPESNDTSESGAASDLIDATSVFQNSDSSEMET